MDQIIKNVVEEISKISPSNIEVLSEICKRTLCQDEVCALYLLQRSKHIVLLVRDNDDYEKNYNRAFLQITELLATLTKFEYDNLIYLRPATVYDDELLCDTNQLSGECQPDIDGVYRVSGDNALNFKGEKIDKTLAEPLLRYLNSFIYPTQQLTEFIERGYLTQAAFDQQESLKVSRRSLYVSRIAIFISICIAIGTCIIPTYVNNEYGYTKLDTIQYDSLMMKIKSDTVVVVQRTLQTPEKMKTPKVNNNSKK